MAKQYLMPYTNLHELNLDWLINAMKQLEASWNEYGTIVEASANTIDSALNATVNVKGDLKSKIDFTFGIPKGTTFTPSITETGVLSWTNDGNRTNPNPVNIKGADGSQGPQGEIGPQGPQGIQGVKGDTGAQGPQGETGPQGPRGLTGAQGPTGPQGERGPSGADGKDLTIKAIYSTLAELQTAHPTGSAGDAYAVGTSTNNYIYIWSVDTNSWANIGQLQGPVGPQGPQGIQGEQGIQGIKGDTGAQGPKGDKGDTGAQGKQGAQGVKGDTGAQGPKGDKGDTGAQGPQGETGPQGPTGATGATGARGPQGETGPQGPTGAGVAEGGVANQLLAKQSSTDFDTKWVSVGTINGASLIGSNVQVQETLVSGTNIKTVNGNSLLGNGDLTISGNLEYDTVETISASNKTIKLKEGNVYLYPQSVLNGVDTDNIIASGVDLRTSAGYTATQDCYVIPVTSRSSWYLNGVEISAANNIRPIMMLKKGQKCNSGSGNETTGNVYGILK